MPLVGTYPAPRLEVISIFSFRTELQCDGDGLKVSEVLVKADDDGSEYHEVNLSEGRRLR